ncbi:MAG: shikimate dehydrogenase [Halieaceae bacterium]
MTAIDRYAVFGNPIRHSRSPWIHAEFARQCEQDLQYRAVLVDIGGFADAASSFFSGGGRGLNVTLPFKGDAFELADELSERAQRAAAVNTLSVGDDNHIRGDNTDGIGLVRDMVANLGWQIRGRRVLVLGAGGAVRGVLELLMKEHPEQLLVVNRTASRAEQVAQDFADLGAVAGGGFELLQDQQFDLVINGTSASLAGELPPLPDSLLTDRSCCYDMMYGSEPTPFMRWAAQHTAWAVSDGLGMLVEQAAESFYLWRGVRPQTGPVLASLRLLLAEDRAS